MKLVAVMSLDAYRDDLHRLLREREIQVFSELDIQGYHQDQKTAGPSFGWFGAGTPPAYSTLTWAFLGDEQATQLLDAVAAFNAQRSLDHPVRAFEMPVERAV